MSVGLRFIEIVTEINRLIPPRSLFYTQGLSEVPSDATFTSRDRLSSGSAAFLSGQGSNGDVRAHHAVSPNKGRARMTSRIALSIAPILLLALGNHAEAATSKSDVHHGAHGRTAAASSRHGKTRTALRTSNHVKVRHVAVRHIDGRQIAYGKRSHGLPDADGWNPVTAGISYPKGMKPVGASVQLTSYTQGPDASASGGDAGDFADATSIQRGVASYYGGRHNGRRTSSGRIFNQHEMTAAHASLPFGTKVLVRVAGTDRTVVVTITDRLFEPHRIIDLSEGAASKLGIVRQGLAMVTLTTEN